MAVVRKTQDDFATVRVTAKEIIEADNHGPPDLLWRHAHPIAAKCMAFAELAVSISSTIEHETSHVWRDLKQSVVMACFRGVITETQREDLEQLIISRRIYVATFHNEPWEK